MLSIIAMAVQRSSSLMQQSHLEGAHDQKSAQLSLTQARLPSQSSSESQSPPPNLQGEVGVQQLLSELSTARQSCSRSFMQHSEMEVWGQLAEPQTRWPAQSESESQSPSASPHGTLAEQQGWLSVSSPSQSSPHRTSGISQSLDLERSQGPVVQGQTGQADHSLHWPWISDTELIKYNF